jgi:hypothetical protein
VSCAPNGVADNAAGDVPDCSPESAGYSEPNRSPACPPCHRTDHPVHRLQNRPRDCLPGRTADRPANRPPGYPPDDPHRDLRSDTNRLCSRVLSPIRAIDPRYTEQGMLALILWGRVLVTCWK